MGCSKRHEMRSRKLEPQVTWVIVEDGVEMLSPSPCVFISSLEGDEIPNEVEIIHLVEGYNMIYHDS